MKSVFLFSDKHHLLLTCRSCIEKQEERDSGGFFHWLIQLCIAPHWRVLVLTFQWSQHRRRAFHTQWQLWQSWGTKWWWEKQTTLSGFYQFLPVWMPFPPPFHVPVFSSTNFPSFLCSSFPQLHSSSHFFCIVLHHLNAWFNSVTYGVLRGISPCLICHFGFVWPWMSTCTHKFRSVRVFVFVRMRWIYSLYPLAPPGFPPVKQQPVNAPSMSNFPGFVTNFFFCAFSASVKCCLLLMLPG